MITNRNYWQNYYILNKSKINQFKYFSTEKEKQQKPCLFVFFQDSGASCSFVR